VERNLPYRHCHLLCHLHPDARRIRILAQQDLQVEARPCLRLAIYKCYEDVSENHIRQNIQSIIEQIVDQPEEGAEGYENKVKYIEEQLPIDKEMSMSIKSKKSMAIDSTIYTATYVSLIKSNKHKYKMTQDDQFDLLYKNMLIGTV